MADDKKKEVKIVDVKGLGEIEDRGKGIFAMSDKDLWAFYEKQGILKPKEVFGTINKANNALIVEAAKFLKDEVIKTGEKQELRCGSGNNRIDVRLHGERTTRNVETGAPVVSYGAVVVRQACKVPESLRKKDGDLFKIAQEIEAAMKTKKR